MVFAAGVFVVALAVFAHGFPMDERRDNIDERGAPGEFYQGDIKLAPGAKAGIIGDRYKWPGRKMIYQIGAGFSLREHVTILMAMDGIEKKTMLCIRFQARTNETDYVQFTRGNSGCWSYVGRQGGRQDLNLEAGNPGCFLEGIVTHEIVHALGFFHEQSRTDRDDYVTINWGNIQSGAEHNFDKYSSSEVDPHGVSYDYGSLMHYSATAFAVTPFFRTIIPRDSNAVIGQRDGLSLKDVLKLRNMYSC
jgi:hypothetical protein